MPRKTLYYANDNTLTIDGQVYAENRTFESTKGTMVRGCAAISPECDIASVISVKLLGICVTTHATLVNLFLT